MQIFNHPIFFAVLMAVAGLGIPVMAALNGGLGAKLHNPPLAATILFFVGFWIAFIYLVIFKGIPSTLYVSNTPWYFYFGGFLVVFYILSITWVAPRFGISNAIAFVLLGQLIAMSLIDHLALFNAKQYPISWKRTIGLIMMSIGVFLVLDQTSKN